MGQWLEIVAGDPFAVIHLEKNRQYLEQMGFFVVIANKWTIERW